MSEIEIKLKVTRSELESEFSIEPQTYNSPYALSLRQIELIERNINTLFKDKESFLLTAILKLQPTAFYDRHRIGVNIDATLIEVQDFSQTNLLQESIQIGH